MEILDYILKHANTDELRTLIGELLARLPDADINNLQQCRNRIAVRRFNDDQAYLQAAVDELVLTLPNGQKSKAYSADIALPSSILGYPVESASVDGLDEFELKWTYFAEPGVLHVEGIPTSPETTKPATRYLQVSIRVESDAGVDEACRTFTKGVKIDIMPDPRELWRDLPVSPDIPYYKENRAAAFIQCSPVQEKSLVAASVRGRSHAHTGKPRDDHFSVKYLEESGWYLMMVADGAGSAEYSRRGSEIACNEAMGACEAWLETEGANLEECVKAYQSDKLKGHGRALKDKLYYLLGGASFKAYRAIADEAKRTMPPRNIRDYATTLLATLAKKIDGYWFVCSFWIGDGAIGLYQSAACCGEKDKEGKVRVKLMGEPDSGESAGQTRFLTMPEIVQVPAQIDQRIRFACVEDFTALFLMTDGVSDPKFDTDNQLKTPAMWEALWRDLNDQIPGLGTHGQDPSEQLLDWLMFWSEGNHDDRTIAILY